MRYNKPNLFSAETDGSEVEWEKITRMGADKEINPVSNKSEVIQIGCDQICKRKNTNPKIYTSFYAHTMINGKGVIMSEVSWAATYTRNYVPAC